MRPISRSRLSVIKKREGEPWIYSYSDLVTNLLAFFMVLFILKTSSKKTQDTLQEGLKEYAEKGFPLSKVDNSKKDLIPDHRELKTIIEDYIKKENLQSSISLEESRTGLALTFQGALLFDSGTAAIRSEAETILGQIGGLLTRLPDRYSFDVEGHADSRPISSVNFPSNWELSSARAGSVVRFLSQFPLSPQRFRAIGYGDTRLLSQSPAFDLAQRRVVVKIDSWLKEP